MSKIILDYSANTHNNDLRKITELIKTVKSYDTVKHEIIFKSQLFVSAGANVVCTHESFDHMYKTCKDLGYQCTASVFDLDSLCFLLTYDIPFVKIANNKKLYHLAEDVPKDIEVIASCNVADYYSNKSPGTTLACVSEYPASLFDYPRDIIQLSDHTKGLLLWHKNKPIIWEKHIKMPGDTGLDAGPFCITPEELADIL